MLEVRNRRVIVTGASSGIGMDAARLLDEAGVQLVILAGFMRIITPFLIDHLPQLTNNNHPIILDIACLNANWPSSGASRRNFSESILLLPDHGAIGIVAAGGNSGGHSFFQRIIK